MASPTVSQLVATTLANYHKEFADNVANTNAVTALLRKGDRIRTANAVASVTLSGPDLAMNRGKERILNLLEGKLSNAETTMGNNITKAVYSDGTVAKSFAGLKAFVTDDGTGTVGG